MVWRSTICPSSSNKSREGVHNGDAPGTAQWSLGLGYSQGPAGAAFFSGRSTDLRLAKWRSGTRLMALMLGGFVSSVAAPPPQHATGVRLTVYGDGLSNLCS